MVTAVTLSGVVLLGALNIWTTRINSLFFFGRTVPDGFPEGLEGRHITAAYLRGVLAATAVTMLLVILMSRLLAHPRPGILVLLQGIAILAVFARANHQVREAVPASNTAAEYPVVQVDLTETASY